MFVLGIDPGLSRCGYGALEELPAGGARPVAVGVLTTAPSSPLPDRLAELQLELRTLIAEIQPDVVVIERVFFQVNVRTAMSVGQASGLAMAEAINAGCAVAQYGPNEVKQAVAGYGAAGKAQVQAMVARLLHLTEVPKPPDAADALALAICHLSAGRFRAAAGAGGGFSGPPPAPGLARAIAAAIARSPSAPTPTHRTPAGPECPRGMESS